MEYRIKELEDENLALKQKVEKLEELAKFNKHEMVSGQLWLQ